MKKLSLFILGCLCFAGVDPVRAAPEIDLIYFHSVSCPSCRLWEADELPKLQASPLWSSVKFTKIAKTIKAPLPGQFWWPKAVAHLYPAVAEKFEASRIKGGTPLSALLIDGKVVSFGFGTRKIAATHLLPLIERAVAAKP